MKSFLYSIHDNVAGKFLHPAMDSSDAAAMRNFSFSVNNEETLMNFRPNDFDLFEVGSFDDELGMIVSTNPPRLVCSATSLIKED